MLTIEDVRPSCAECVVGYLAVRSLAPGERLELPVTYAATDVPGKHRAHVTFLTNDQTNPLRRVYLDVDIKAVKSPRLIVEPEHADFGVVIVGGTVQPTVTLHNVGEAPLEIKDFTLSPGLSIEGELPARLAADQKHLLKLKLTASQPGVVRAHVALVTNQPDRKVTTVPLSGYAARPDQVERILTGVLVRSAQERDGMDVLNRAGHMVWLTVGGAQKPIPPSGSLYVSYEQAREGERIRLVLQFPLPQENPLERKAQ